MKIKQVIIDEICIKLSGKINHKIFLFMPKDNFDRSEPRKHFNQEAKNIKQKVLVMIEQNLNVCNEHCA